MIAVYLMPPEAWEPLLQEQGFSLVEPVDLPNCPAEAWSNDSLTILVPIAVEGERRVSQYQISRILTSLA